MKNIYFYILSLAFFFTACEENTVEPEQFGFVEGKIIDAETLEPLEDVRVSSTPVTETVFTDENGNFVLDHVPTGSVTIEAYKRDYLSRFEAINIVQDEVTEVTMDMELETANNRPPLAPVLIGPPDASTNLPLTVELTWNSAVDEEEDEVTYTLSFFEEGSSDIMKFEELEDTTFVVEDLYFNTRYYWQISAKDDINEEESVSEIWSFLTVPFPDNRIYFTREVDGNNVIYSTSQDIENPQTVQITSMSNNSWRPRQNPTIDLVAFLRNVGSETHIFTMNPDGSNLIQVTDVPIAGFRESEIDFTWTHDGEKILYPYFDKLYSINKDGSGIQLMYQTPNGKYISEADWSSDGSFFALKVNNSLGYEAEIYTVDMTGNPIDTLLIDSLGAAGGLNITVDMKHILYTRDVSNFENSTYRQLNSRMFLYNIADSTHLDISMDKDDGTNDLDPRLSPNEASVIFLNTSNDGVSTKFIMRQQLDETRRETIITDGFMPDWE